MSETVPVLSLQLSLHWPFTKGVIYFSTRFVYFVGFVYLNIMNFVGKISFHTCNNVFSKSIGFALSVMSRL